MTSHGQIPRELALSFQRGKFSVYAFLIAWLLGSVLLSVGSLDPGDRWMRAVEGLGYCVLIALFHALPAWGFVMLPLSLVLRATSILINAAVAPCFGAVCGACAAAGELAMWPVVVGDLPVHDPQRFWGYGAAVGACAWSLFCWMLRRCEAALPTRAP